MKVRTTFKVETDDNGNIALLATRGGGGTRYSTDLSTIQIMENQWAIYVTFRDSDGKVIVQHRITKVAY